MPGGCALIEFTILGTPFLTAGLDDDDNDDDDEDDDDDDDAGRFEYAGTILDDDEDDAELADDDDVGCVVAARALAFARSLFSRWSASALICSSVFFGMVVTGGGAGGAGRWSSLLSSSLNASSMRLV